MTKRILTLAALLAVALAAVAPAAYAQTEQPPGPLPKPGDFLRGPLPSDRPGPCRPGAGDGRAPVTASCERVIEKTLNRLEQLDPNPYAKELEKTLRRLLAPCLRTRGCRELEKTIRRLLTPEDTEPEDPKEGGPGDPTDAPR